MSGSNNTPLGYKNPPSWARFLPGQSGNPKGRPKKQVSTSGEMGTPKASGHPHSVLDDVLRAELDRTILVTEGGKSRKVKAGDLVARAQIKAALKGNVHAQQHVMKAMRDLELRDAEREALKAQQDLEKHKDDQLVYNYMVRKKRERQAVWDEALAQGTEPDQPWPHPDDILLFPESLGFKPRGPYKQSEVSLFQYYRAQRDVLFAQSVLKACETPTRSNALSDAYMVLWLNFDMMLPLRWQINKDFSQQYFELYLMPIEHLRNLVEDRYLQMELMKHIAGMSDVHDKDTYRTVNATFKPLLKKMGYRSLAEFERAFETHGENMPWPKTINEVGK